MKLIRLLLNWFFGKNPDTKYYQNDFDYFLDKYATMKRETERLL